MGGVFVITLASKSVWLEMAGVAQYFEFAVIGMVGQNTTDNPIGGKYAGFLPLCDLVRLERVSLSMPRMTCAHIRRDAWLNLGSYAAQKTS